MYGRRRNMYTGRDGLARGGRVYPKSQAKFPVHKEAARFSVCSAPFIEFFSTAHEPDSVDRKNDLASRLQGLSDGKQLDVLTCLMTKVPYSSYRGLFDKQKDVVRASFIVMHHHMINERIKRFVPGHMEEMKRMAHVASVMATDMNETSYKDVVMKEFERSAEEANKSGRNLDIGGVMSSSIVNLKRQRGLGDDINDMTQ